MAKNNLTPEQDLATREFYTKVVCDPNAWTGLDTKAKYSHHAIMHLLGYNYVAGRYVSPDKIRPVTYGQQQQLECEWEDDTRRAEREVNKNNSTDTTDSSVEAEGAEVREAVLREDV